MPRRRADWGLSFKLLEKAGKRLINWSPSVVFPPDEGFPTSRPVLRSIAIMCFNPDPAQRLRLVPIQGMSLSLLNSRDGTDMDYRRSYYSRHCNDCRGSHSGYDLLCMHNVSKDHCS